MLKETKKKEIMHILLRHKERGWIISNLMNPFPTEGNIDNK